MNATDTDTVQMPTRANFETNGQRGSHDGNFFAGTSPCSCPRCGYNTAEADDKADDARGDVRIFGHSRWTHGRETVFRFWELRFKDQLWSAYACARCGFYGQCRIVDNSVKTHTLKHQQMCHMHGKSIFY